MRIRQLDPGNPADVRQWVEFPFQLYKGNAQWVPNLVSDDKEKLDKSKHPYYQHSEADFFVVESDGSTLGRVAALENRNFNAYQNRQGAFFGYIEFVDDPAVSGLLLATVENWAAGRGLQEVIGPRGLAGVDGSTLVKGFEHRPALTIPYNYAYYDAHIKAAGYEPYGDYLSGYAYIPSHVWPDRVRRIAEKVKERRGFHIKRFQSKREMREWVPRAMTTLNEAMSHLHTFFPPTPAEVDRIVGALSLIANPRLIKLIMKDEEIAGFVVSYPDVSAGLQKARGRMWPLGWFHLLLDLRRTKWLNVNGLGLLPKYQGLGANAMLYTEMYDTITSMDFEHADIVQVNVENFRSRSDLESLGAEWYKQHRHYRKDI